jgi:hypothetical protein
VRDEEPEECRNRFSRAGPCEGAIANARQGGNRPRDEAARKPDRSVDDCCARADRDEVYDELPADTDSALANDDSARDKRSLEGGPLWSAARRENQTLTV